jgi:hypothetical protein
MVKRMQLGRVEGWHTMSPTVHSSCVFELSTRAPKK